MLEIKVVLKLPFVFILLESGSVLFCYDHVVVLYRRFHRRSLKENGFSDETGDAVTGGHGRRKGP